MKRTRQILAITLVAAALCADRAIASSPSLRPAIASRAGQLVARLSVSFRRVVPAVPVYQTRHSAILANIQIPPMASDDSSIRQARLSPLLLRLPPPSLC